MYAHLMARVHHQTIVCAPRVNTLVPNAKSPFVVDWPVIMSIYAHLMAHAPHQTIVFAAMDTLETIVNTRFVLDNVQTARLYVRGMGIVIRQMCALVIPAMMVHNASCLFAMGLCQTNRRCAIHMVHALAQIRASALMGIQAMSVRIFSVTESLPLQLPRVLVTEPVLSTRIASVMVTGLEILMVRI